MFPKLFQIPFTNLTVWTYGVLMVIGFISAIALIRRLSRDITPDPQYITNAALYSLIAGIAGARLFYVVHYFDTFRHNLLSVFAIWEGGLELLGGVILAITVIILYLRYHKLPALQYLDILAIALLLALGFGRIGCFMRGCCFGKPANPDMPWAVCFPYGSPAFLSQIQPDPKRNREDILIKLPDEFFGYTDADGKQYSGLKPFEYLTEQQQKMATKGIYRALPVHPTQLYSAANGFLSCFLLYLFWRRSKKTANIAKLFTKPGSSFAMMLILYAIARFTVEFIRDDNPIGFAGLTISQRMCLFGLIPIGIALIIIFHKLPRKKTQY
ncbi:prolipoprotein diacylglyceryl transferase [Planctomycetota bacterium]